MGIRFITGARCFYNLYSGPSLYKQTNTAFESHFVGQIDSLDLIFRLDNFMTSRGTNRLLTVGDGIDNDGCRRVIFCGILPQQRSARPSNKVPMSTM